MADFREAPEAGNEPPRCQRAAIGSSHVPTVLACHEAVQVLVDAVGGAAVDRESRSSAG